MGVVRQEFSGLSSVEAIFVDVGQGGTRVWIVINRGNRATFSALKVREHEVRRMRLDLKLNFLNVPLPQKRQKASLLEFFRNSGATCAYLRKPKRHVA
ncbi:MAG: hypothetical protein HYT42_02255 [Candidatus Sungbacteria bacterium]|nr:hypothetical protein [Candidatus Sungbacteria bacterium]